MGARTQAFGRRIGRMALLIGCALFLGPLAASTAHAESGAARAETVRFCYNVWEPYAYRDGDALTGVSIAILREAAKRAGLAAEFVEYPWNRCLQSVRDGEIDAIMDAAERAEFLQGPTSYSAYSNTFWVASDSAIATFSFEALRGRTVGLVKGYSYPDDLLNGLKTAEAAIDYAVDDQANIRKLAFGRVDAIVADHVSTLWFAGRNNLKVRALAPDHSSDPLYPSFSQKRPDLHGRIEGALRDMMDDGTVKRMYSTHVHIPDAAKAGRSK